MIDSAESLLVIGHSTEWGERIRRKTPAARWGTGEDLVATAVFLASRASDFVTGVALPVDGGYAVADRLLPEWELRSRGPAPSGIDHQDHGAGDDEPAGEQQPAELPAYNLAGLADRESPAR